MLNIQPKNRTASRQRSSAIRVSILVAIVCGVVTTGNPIMAADGWSVSVEKDATTIRDAKGVEVLRYVTRQPADSKLSVKSACYIHPLNTPSGKTVTEVAPADHPHHRGVFLAFMDMKGDLSGDFWGWGEHAPKENRVIEHVAVTRVRSDANSANCTFKNAWKVADKVLIDEVLEVHARRTHAVKALTETNAVDLTYSLTPTTGVRLPRWAFSGFCARLRKDGPIEYTSANGVESRPAVNPLKPELNWPAQAWYDATVKLSDGSQVGVTVIDHPDNPKSTWHNEVSIRMINPCIMAPGEVTLKAGKPLVLRYRLIAHDGTAPAGTIRDEELHFRMPGGIPR